MVEDNILRSKGDNPDKPKGGSMMKDKLIMNIIRELKRSDDLKLIELLYDVLWKSNNRAA